MQPAVAAIVILFIPFAAAADADTRTRQPERLAPGVTLLPGAMLPGRGPDGNTVVFDAPDGSVVIDTGRHAWHGDGILAFAEASHRPIAAILNTHWHLDHASGNGRIKSKHPAARLYTTNAVDRVLGDGGFLARNLEGARARLAQADVGALEKEEIGIFVQTMAEREDLRPDVAVAASGPMTIAGRAFELRVTDRAVTDADLWLYDPASGIAVIGDLMTLPAPFFETACPDQWRAALDEVWAVPFRTAIPGHGEPMSRDQFDTWRGAFNAFMDCVEGSGEPAQCATAWQAGIATLLGEDQRMCAMALEYAQYYVGMLRQNGGRSADCLAR